MSGDSLTGARLTDRIGIGVLTRLVPRDTVDEILAETGRREQWSRLLPAHVVVYFVMAMAIFGDGYEEVMRRLVGGLQFMELAAKLSRALEPGMLVMADRGFFSFPLWAEFMSAGADLLFRVASGMKLPAGELLPDGSYLSEVTSKKVRSSGYRIPLAAVGDPREATHIPVRVVEYTVSGAGQVTDQAAFSPRETLGGDGHRGQRDPGASS